MTPEVRPTQSGDIPALQTVVDQTQLFPSEMLPKMFSPSLSREQPAVWLTCHVEDAAVGLCYAVAEELTDGTWNMLALAVRPDSQGKGLGSLLVRELERELKSVGHRILIVETSSTQSFDLTRRFYAQNGYEEEARIRDFWALGDAKVIFRKTL